MSITPSAQYSLTIRIEIAHRPGMLGQVASAIGKAGGIIGAVDLIEVTEDTLLRDITVDAADQEQWEAITAAIDAVDGVRVVDTTDRTFLLHVGGKIDQNKQPLKTRDDLSMAYTPGVARVCMAIAETAQGLPVHDQAQHGRRRHRRHRRARAGRHRPGGGDAGHGGQGDALQGVRRRRRLPDLPGHQGRGRDRRDRGAHRAGLRGINLEDISAPRCFEIEDRLKEQLDIPVFHDDQHGTAVVVLAALLNACRIIGN